EAGGDRVSEMVMLVFDVELNRQVYEDSAWGDPPQLAIWLENEADGSIRTVAVTHRTGAGDWEGKVECSVALPYWIAFYNRETGTKGPPTWNHPAADAITCATPRATLNAVGRVGRDSQWEYCVEVNVSGDYNVRFPSLSDEGRSDRYGNGQPSLVYRGSIEAVEGAKSRPILVGRTDQHEPVRELATDLREITTARALLRSIHVSCRRNGEVTRSKERERR
ncbi:MAG: hypothetical protein ACYTAS_08365, partial [Planctomycetota bacterium]